MSSSSHCIMWRSMSRSTPPWNTPSTLALSRFAADMRRRESSTLAKSDCSRLPGNFFSMAAISSTSASRVASTPWLRSDGASRASVRAWPWTASTSASIDSRGIERRARPGAFVGVERSLDELHGVVAIEPVQLTAVAGGVERRGERLAAGEDDARVAHLQQALADGEDGLQLPARLRGECLGRFEVGRQEDALHVVRPRAAWLAR